jgi:hypothetical protein
LLDNSRGMQGGMEKVLFIGDGIPVFGRGKWNL